MKEFEGGAFTVVLSSTTLPCIGASVVSVGASYVLSGIFG